MTAFALSLEIKTVGAREAERALDDLDRKGRKIVDDAAGALGKSMGSVAVAYQTGGKRMKQALEEVAEGHRTVIRESERQAASAESLGMRQAHALSTASRGLEMLGRTGQLTGRSLDAVLGQASSVAFAFGPTGQVVGAIGIATAAVVEMFMRTSREAKKLAMETANEFNRIAHMDLVAQGREASLLYSGDPNESRVDENGLPNLARFGVKELERQRADFAKRAAARDIVGGPGGIERRMTVDAGLAAEALKRVNEELEKRNRLITAIMGTNGQGGSLERAAAVAVAGDQPSFTTDANAKAARDAKADQAFKDKLANDNNKEAIRRFKEAQRLQDEQDESIIADALKRADVELAAAAKAKAVVTRFANQMEREIGGILASGIVAGFETAFSGKGIGNAFKTLTATVLAGLGGFMETLGAQMIVVGLALDALAASLLSLNGPAAIAAGVALIAAGAGLKAIAGRFGGDSSSSGGGGSGSSYGGSSSAAPDFLRFGVQAATPTTSQQAPPAKASATFNIFGPDDPKAQRAIADAWNRANARGLVTA